MATTNTIVILGAGWAGLPLAHKLLKYTVPKIPSLKIVLVTPNSHFFWNVAATRGIIPGEIPDEQLFLPIAPAFSQYPAENFELLLGTADAVDDEHSSVRVERSDGSHETLQFTHLVIATGSRLASNLPLKLIGTHKATLDAWREVQARLSTAKTVVIAGAGATGVEVAGEIAASYGKAKQVTLVSSGDKPIPGALDSVRTTVSRDLESLGVNVIANARTAEVRADSSGRQSIITLTNGDVLHADLYLPLNGITLNTSFLPAKFLDDAGSVKVEPSMCVSGTSNIWAIGDAANLESKQLTVTDGQIIHLAVTLDAIMTGAPPRPPYRPQGKSMIFISLGRKFATGQIGGWKLYGWMVSWVKGRKLFVDTAQGYVGGKHLRHAAM